MSQQIQYVKFESFLSSKGVGRINLDQSINRLRALCDVWNMDVNQNVLVDMRERTFDLVAAEIKHFTEMIGETGLGRSNKVAIVYRHRETLDPPTFVEALARDKGLRIRAFDDYEEATDWLVSTKVPVARFEQD